MRTSEERKEAAKLFREEVQRVMGGDEWLADATLDYIEHLYETQIDRAFCEGIHACASPDIRPKRKDTAALIAADKEAPNASVR